MSDTIDSLKAKLMPVLKTDNFWTQLMECIGEELGLLKDDMGETKKYFDIYSQYEDGLINISNEFGYSPNLIVNNDLSTVLKEVESIPFRIRNKTTYDGYYIILKQIDRIGEIYNYYWSGKKLIKAIKWQNIVDVLNGGFDKTTPFIDVIADKNFSTISISNPISLDSGINLDELIGQWNWMLDENMEISPTKHLGIEYYIRDISDFSEDGKNIMTEKYLQYLASGSEYTRRLPIVPHIGLMINGIMNENGSCNFFNSNLTYSTPKLKLKCGMGYAYTSRISDYGGFDLDSDGTLDALITWTLDKSYSTSSRYKLGDFKYISCGCGSLNIVDNKNVDIFPNSKMILFYTYSDNDDSYTIKDYSFNASNAKICCVEDSIEQTKKVKGIVGKCVDFQGTNYIKTDNQVALNQITQSFGFWLNANVKDYFDNEDKLTIFDWGKFKIEYVYAEEKLYYTIDTIENSIDVSKNTVHNFIFEFNEDNEELNIYLDAEIVATESLSGVDYSGYEYLFIGISSDLDDSTIFQGIIDSTWLFAKIFSQSEKEFIFNNRQGIITQLGGKLACYPLDIEHEGFVSKKMVGGNEIDDWYLVQSHVKANDITDEFVSFALPSTSSDISYQNVFSNYDELDPTKRVFVRKEIDGIDYYADRYNFDGLTPSVEVYHKTVNGLTNYLYKKPNIESYYYDLECTSEYVGSLDGYVKDDYSYYENVPYTETHLINTSYSGNANYYPIENEYFEITYKKYAENKLDIINVNLKADNKGNFYNEETNETVSGHIDYESGAFELNSTTQRQVTQEVIGNSEHSKVIFVKLKRGNSSTDSQKEVVKKSLSVIYTINNTQYIATDDGYGSMVGVIIKTSMIDYESGDLYIELNEEYEGDVLANYKYNEDLEIIDGTPIVLNYKTTNSVKISEIALENENHEIIAYMTFPPFESYSINNHISAMFCIKLNN